jgi:hypothetical protein
MKHYIKSTIACTGVLLLAACASITTPPSTPASGTVRIKEWSAAYYGSASTGKGTLNYHGQSHHFTISAVGAGGGGAQEISASGKVYYLNNLSDFSGTYTGISKGLTLIEGHMHAKLTNPNGVTLYIAGETEGLASSLGGAGIPDSVDRLRPINLFVRSGNPERPAALDAKTNQTPIS